MVIQLASTLLKILEMYCDTLFLQINFISKILHETSSPFFLNALTKRKFLNQTFLTVLLFFVWLLTIIKGTNIIKIQVSKILNTQHKFSLHRYSYRYLYYWLPLYLRRNFSVQFLCTFHISESCIIPAGPSKCHLLLEQVSTEVMQM